MLNVLNVRRAALAVIAVAAFLPWVTVGPFSLALTAGDDGYIMIAVALAALALTFRNVRYLSVLATVGVGAFAVEEAIRIGHDVSQIPTSIFGSASVGIGLILAFVAGVTAIGAIAYPYVEARRAETQVSA